MSTAVVYLARYTEGPDAVREFLSSYRDNPAGAPHELIVIEKGFPEFFSLKEAGLIDETVQVISISDEGFDLTAYRIAAEALVHDKLFFLNTFSRILVPNWLAKFEAGFALPDVGIVGATGSYESLNYSLREVGKAVWLCHQNIPYDHELAAKFWPDLVQHAPAWMNQSRLRKALGRLRRPLGLRRYDPALDQQFEDYWPTVCGPGGVFEAYADFPGFPNPHIRSNAFMIARKDLLAWLPAGIMTKEQCYVAESGPNSVSISAAKAGKRMLIVGADGQIFDIPDWPKSRTFRLGQQANIIVSDNQTCFHDSLDDRRRKMYAFLSWGRIDQKMERTMAREARSQPKLPPEAKRTSWPPTSRSISCFGENSFGMFPLDAPATLDLTGVRPPMSPNS